MTATRETTAVLLAALTERIGPEFKAVYSFLSVEDDDRPDRTVYSFVTRKGQCAIVRGVVALMDWRAVREAFGDAKITFFIEPHEGEWAETLEFIGDILDSYGTEDDA